MDICIVGNGGREDALKWHAEQHGHDARFITGNIESLVKQAEGSDLTIVGPEQPLVDGIYKRFWEAGIPLFGHSQQASQLEGSKIFAKLLMNKYGIPTADFFVSHDPYDAKKIAKSMIDNNGGGVLKADGLAAGKGVILFSSVEEAYKAIDDMMVKRIFGDAGKDVVIEEKLSGTELSFIALTDGSTVIPLASSQDHKAVYGSETDRQRFIANCGIDYGRIGYNTGGMGAFSPSPLMEKHNGLYRLIMSKIMMPVVDAMRSEGKPMLGVVYAGLMIDGGYPKVLEFNVRFGDPEIQPLLMRLKSDLVPYFKAAIDGRLEEMPSLQWDSRPAVGVVMASRNYPGSPDKGPKGDEYIISGIDEVNALEDVHVFEAGVKRGEDGKARVGGGRVVCVTALDEPLASAAQKAYSGVDKIHWEGEYHRTDIAKEVA